MSLHFSGGRLYLASTIGIPANSCRYHHHNFKWLGTAYAKACCFAICMPNAYAKIYNCAEQFICERGKQKVKSARTMDEMRLTVVSRLLTRMYQCEKLDTTKYSTEENITISLMNECSKSLPDASLVQLIDAQVWIMLHNLKHDGAIEFANIPTYCNPLNKVCLRGTKCTRAFQKATAFGNFVVIDNSVICAATNGIYYGANDLHEGMVKPIKPVDLF